MKNKHYLILLVILFMFCSMDAQVVNGRAVKAVNKKEAKVKVTKIRPTSWQEGMKLRVELGLGSTISSSLDGNLTHNKFFAASPKITLDYAINQNMQFGISLNPVLSSAIAFIPSLDFRGYLGSPEQNWRFYYNAQLGITLFASDAYAELDNEVKYGNDDDDDWYWNQKYYYYVYSETSNSNYYSAPYVEEAYYGNSSVGGHYSWDSPLDNYYPYKKGGLNLCLSGGMEFKRGFFLGISYTIHRGKWDKYGFKRWKFEGSDEWFYGKIAEAGVEKFFSHSIMFTAGWNIPLSKSKEGNKEIKTIK